MTYYHDNGIHFSLMLQWIWYTHQFQHFLFYIWNIDLRNFKMFLSCILERVSQQKCANLALLKLYNVSHAQQESLHGHSNLSNIWLHDSKHLKAWICKPFATVDDKELHPFPKHTI
jgi:hypothetical protein